MLHTITLIIALIGAVIGLISVIVRAVEAIYQLEQTPGLSTIQQCWQVLKNFFTIETYSKK
jgi:hypothetical protein